MNWIISMAKNIHQMIILDIDTDQTRSENIDPNYWNYFSREKYWLHCLSYENIEWIVVAKKNVNQMKKCRAWNKNFSPFNPSYTMIKFRSKLLNYFSDKKYRLNVEVAKNVNWWIIMVKKNVDQMKEYRAQNLNLSLF